MTKILFCILLALSAAAAGAETGTKTNLSNHQAKEHHKIVLGEKLHKDATYLFVLHGKKGQLSKTKLLIKDFYPHILYFSDMPHRIAGVYNSAKFMNSWGQFFTQDNPNIIVTFYDTTSKEYKDIAVEVSNPLVKDSDLVFTVNGFLKDPDILDDKKRIKFKELSLFIDSIGCWIPACRN